MRALNGIGAVVFCMAISACSTTAVPRSDEISTDAQVLQVVVSSIDPAAWSLVLDERGDASCAQPSLRPARYYDLDTREELQVDRSLVGNLFERNSAKPLLPKLVLPVSSTAQAARITLSLPVYDSSQQQAMLCMSTTISAFGGEHMLVGLRKSSRGDWTVAWRSPTVMY